MTCTDEIYTNAYAGLCKLSGIACESISVYFDLLYPVLMCAGNFLRDDGDMCSCTWIVCENNQHHYPFKICITESKYKRMNELSRKKFIVKTIVNLCKSNDVVLTEFKVLHKGTSLEELAVLGDLHDVH